MGFLTKKNLKTFILVFLTFLMKLFSQLSVPMYWKSISLLRSRLLKPKKIPRQCYCNKSKNKFSNYPSGLRNNTNLWINWQHKRKYKVVDQVAFFHNCLSLTNVKIDAIFKISLNGVVPPWSLVEPNLMIH